MTHPLTARLVLLASAAALAAALVFAMIVAEHRDVDGPAKGAAPAERVAAPAPDTPAAGQARAVAVSTRGE